MASAPPQNSPPSPTPPSTSSDTPPPSSSTPPPASPPPSSPPPSSPPPTSAPPPASTSPPPPSNDSPPPPVDNGSPPPPSDSNSSSPPPNNNNSNSPPPPPSSNNNNNNSPPPPPNNNNGDNNNRFSPPPPPPPPPPPRSRHSPPPPKSLTPRSRDTPSNNDGGSSNSGNNNIVPIAVGVGVGVAALLLLGFIAYLCTSKKKKKRLEYDYYADQNLGAKGGNYYNSPSPANNWQSPASQKNGNLPPPPGVYGAWSSSPQQPNPPSPQPPLPPGVMTSSDMSSNFSGPYGPPLPPPHPSVALGFNQSSFSYDELASATGNFTQANLLGQGGFGYVHKGVLPNGKEIAVKSLKAGSGQGDREFQAEVEIISRVHHRHLVSLVGYCIAGGQRLLVYEFLPNSTLEFHLYGKGRPTMDWPTRIKIALGSAKGLAYLHEDCHPRIIHRDIKAANILLDLDFEAKVADFGLAKLSTDNNTHVSTRVMGTFGYLAPEYASSGKLTDKSDVFSFGVMLLELITGRRPIDLNGDMDESLVDWARPVCAAAVESGNFSELADPRLEGNYDHAEMARMVASAGAAVRHSGRRRAKMSHIVRALEGDMSLDHLISEPVKPGQSTIISSTSGSSDYENTSYSADMKKFRKVVMDNSQEYASSEYGHTSEYGLNPSSSSSEDASKVGTVLPSRKHSP
ncbi:putative proline-rich receptor-like protein kinase PERK6 [Mercurialis annua]|uniref:putative proline-rich receptor-like protein kinase PERK6 n=1 Tax=Mercurialis annua TaxID=3986 RepID=UPI00215FC65B|nr:putative proline-rich receptor-like protein kinase PERK6 [Mercurialis annua]